MVSTQHNRPQNEPSTPIIRISRWRDRCLVWVIGLLVRLLYATLRIKATARFQSASKDNSRTNVFLLWHNRIFLGPLLYRYAKRKRPVYTMVSASKDGAIATAVIENLGIRAIRGSSSRRSIQSLREMIDHLQHQCDIVITPDGPRGPLYSMSASAALLLRHTPARIALLSCTALRPWRIKSWDGCYIPKPFSTVEFDIEILEDSLRTADLTDYTFRDVVKARYDAITVDTLPHPCPEADNKSPERERR